VNQLLNLFVRLQTTLASLRDREDGQTMAEYGVVLAVITLAAIAAFQALGGKVDDAINQVVGILP